MRIFLLFLLQNVLSALLFFVSRGRWNHLHSLNKWGGETTPRRTNRRAVEPPLAEQMGAVEPPPRRTNRGCDKSHNPLFFEKSQITSTGTP